MSKKSDDTSREIPSQKRHEGENSIPGWLADLTDQGVLTINRNNAHEIGLFLGKLTHLRKLEIDYVYSHLEWLESSLPKLKYLEDLLIEESSTSEIVPHLGELEQLRRLKLAFLVDDLTSLPSSLAKNLCDRNHHNVRISIFST